MVFSSFPGSSVCVRTSRWAARGLFLFLLLAPASLSLFAADPPGNPEKERENREGDNDPISTDRPDRVDSAKTVGKGVFQIETGYNRDNSDRENPAAHTTTAGGMIRYGLTDSFEIRVDTDGRVWERGRPRQNQLIQTGSAPAILTNLVPVLPGSSWSMVSNPNDMRDLLLTGQGPLPVLRNTTTLSGPLVLAVDIEMGPGQMRCSGFCFPRRTRVSTSLLLQDANVRYPMGGDDQLRLENRFETESRVSSGSGDVGVGFKYTLPVEGGALMPTMGIVASAGTGAGSGPFRGSGSSGNIGFAAEWELPAEFGLGTVISASRDKDEWGKQYTVGFFAITVGIPLSDSWDTFVEYSAGQDPGGSIVGTWDTGLKFRPMDNLQFDIFYSRAASKGAPTNSVGFGLSYRL